ncbi:MAG: hypothetical protein RXR82_07345 [Nitrososphaeria archaeon]
MSLDSFSKDGAPRREPLTLDKVAGMYGIRPEDLEERTLVVLGPGEEISGTVEDVRIIGTVYGSKLGVDVRLDKELQTTVRNEDGTRSAKRLPPGSAATLLVLHKVLVEELLRAAMLANQAKPLARDMDVYLALVGKHIVVRNKGRSGRYYDYSVEISPGS